MPPNVDDPEWADAIARGAPPLERLRHAAFRMGDVDAAATDSAQRWLDVIGGGSPDRESAVLATLGVRRSDVPRAFGHARLERDREPPAWLRCLVETIVAFPDARSGNNVAGNATEAGAEALIDAASRLLDWNDLRARHPMFEPQVLAPLTIQLATRIVLACAATLQLENVARSDTVWDFSRTAWMERLCGFAGLNFVVGTAIRQWQQNTREILVRAATDRPLLVRTLFDGVDPGPVVGIETDLGDRHNDGRAVAILTFADGRRAVYKPKDLRCASRFLALLTFLNEAATGLTFPTRRIVDRGRYAWEEYVEQRSTATGEAAARFFERFGMLLRILQLVEGRDFWLDNLRVCGDAPVFIDLECVLHPRLRRRDPRVSVAGLALQLHEESVLPTAAVSHAIDIPDVGPQDFGALSAPGPRVLPLGTWSGYPDQRNGNLSLQGGRLYWDPQVAWPRADGGLADPVDYLDALEAGYRRADALLRARAVPLRAPGSPLAGIADVPVRALMRSTWEYLVFLRASLEPTALLDGNARELVLAHVVATAPGWTDDDDAPQRLAIACAEMHALRNLDIPEFYSLPSSTLVMDATSTPLGDVFEACASDRLEHRLRTADAFDVDAHAGILRDAVRSMARGDNRPAPTSARP